MSAGTQGAALREHRRPFDCVERVGAAREDQPVFRFVVHPGAYRYLVHPPLYSGPKLFRLAVDLLRPRPPLPHGPGRKEASPSNSYADGVSFFAQGSEVGWQETLPELGREGNWTVDDSPPEGRNPRAKLLALDASFLMIDCKCEKRRLQLPASDRAFREFMTSRVT